MPGGGGGEEITVCFAVYRELWLWDYAYNFYRLAAVWFLGVVCYTT